MSGQVTQEYIGDGVYVTMDEGGTVWLDVRAQSQPTIGPSGTPSIALEPSVLATLNRWVQRENMRREAEAKGGVGQ